MFPLSDYFQAAIYGCLATLGLVAADWAGFISGQTTMAGVICSSLVALASLAVAVWKMRSDERHDALAEERVIRAEERAERAASEARNSHEKAAAEIRRISEAQSATNAKVDLILEKLIDKK
jgi:biopolymer transport protein ExbB/TolQ